MAEDSTTRDDLSAAYARCRDLHREHGRTYYLATMLLPAWKRRHVHALYGFTRYADDIVDSTATLPVADRAARLRAWSTGFLAGLDGVPVDDPLLPAVLHTIRVFGIDRADFTTFLASMAMDLTVTSYGTYDDLLAYMDGSAAVIGTMMLPVLESTAPAVAREPARQLGLAFQLTNFIRDVAEDLDLGRVYLPRADLARFGVTPDDLRAAAAARRATPAVRELIAYEVARARTHYAAAAAGIPLLARSSQACIRAAYCVYGAILTEIERQDHDVFVGRAVVPKLKRLALAARCLATRAGCRPPHCRGRCAPVRPDSSPAAGYGPSMPERYNDYDRIAIVTGSDSGIGAASAVALAEAGFDIGITYHNDKAGAEETAAAVRAAGRRAEMSHLDLAGLPDAAAVVDELAEALGGLGVLVNNAGTGTSAPFTEMSWEDWRHVLAVDLEGPFLCGQRAARRMISAGRGGRIINITSVHEHAPRVGSGAYCAAKGGLGLLTRVMAQELAAEGITVNAVAPGEIATPMTGQADVDPFTVDRPGVPVGRPGAPREIGTAVAFLASPDAAYVTGASWVIDGGMLLMGPQAGSHLGSGEWRSG